MKTMKLWRIAFVMLAAFSIASCGSDEPRYADPEAHEKTVKLNEQYGPLMFGTWHYENISDTQRYFERLTFAYADATTLRIQGYYVKDPDGWINYQRGPSEPSF